MLKDRVVILFHAADEDKYQELRVQLLSLRFRFPIEPVGYSDPKNPQLLKELDRGWALVLICTDIFFTTLEGFPEVIEVLAQRMDAKKLCFGAEIAPVELPSWLQQRKVLQWSRLQEDQDLDSFFKNLATALAYAWAPRGRLAKIRLENVGPAPLLRINCAPRLNIITGDNSLGKTFLLDCIWWSLTGNWIKNHAEPRLGDDPATITYAWKGSGNVSQLTSITEKYDRLAHKWPAHSSPFQSVVLYARADGRCSIWDPNRAQREKPSGFAGEWSPLHFHAESIWKEHTLSANGRDVTLFPGVEKGWMEWLDRDPEAFQLFSAALEGLSGEQGETLRSGEPIFSPTLNRIVPTLLFPYGPVPFYNVAEGAKRLIALAYVVVWVLIEHRRLSFTPLKHVVILLDEVENHLHPKWARLILPRLLKMAKKLWQNINIQFFVTTHSPIVLAGVEPFFNRRKDSLLHLGLEGRAMTPSLRKLPFLVKGTVDRWITSEAFGLHQARSLEAELWIDQAKALLEARTPDPKEIQKVHGELRSLLSEHDPLWPRWIYFAENHGAAS